MQSSINQDMLNSYKQKLPQQLFTPKQQKIQLTVDIFDYNPGKTIIHDALYAQYSIFSLHSYCPKGQCYNWFSTFSHLVTIILPIFLLNLSNF